MNELVSVVTPTHKRSDTLLRAVESVLRQSYANIEMLVVDDNEPGDSFSRETQRLLSTVRDPRVRYVSQKKHINGAAARNAGIRTARGAYVAFLDDDDEWFPEKVEKQLRFLEDRRVQGVSCLYELFLDGRLDRKGPFIPDDNLLFDILSRKVQIMAGSSFFCLKSALVESGMFDERFTRHQDLQMLVDFLSKHRMAVLPEYLVRIHADSTSNHPPVRAMAEIKQQFLSAMHTRIAALPPSQQRRIRAAHWFEIVVAALKTKDFPFALRHLLKIGFCPQAYADVWKRFLDRRPKGQTQEEQQ